MERSTDALICPVCRESLAEEGSSLRCARGHAFDRAREGFFDLLPHGHGRTNIPGDTKEMVRARRRFLAGGHYRPLADAIVRITSAHLDTMDLPSGPDWRVRILDAGCGEGHYGGSVAEAIGSGRGGSHLFGLDISRPALSLAARSYRDGVFFRNDVGTGICLADASIDVLLDVFAPRNAVEFARVLRPGGLMLVVIPTESHLLEIRALLPLLRSAPEKRERTAQQFSADFALTHEEVIEYAMDLTGEGVLDLIRMTPSAHHLEEARLRDVDSALEVTAGFRVLCFVR